MHEFSRFTVTGGALWCPRMPYPVPIERCYRCRFFRDLQESLRGEDLVCCDYIEVGVESELRRSFAKAGRD